MRDLSHDGCLSGQKTKDSSYNILRLNVFVLAQMKKFVVIKFFKFTNMKIEKYWISNNTIEICHNQI